MEVRDFIKKCNKNISINLASIFQVKKKYLSLYRAGMVRLYDEGYISDPTRFNEKEIRKNIYDFKIAGMVRNSGLVQLDSRQVGFSICKNKGISEEAFNFLCILKEVLYYRECCSEIDKFYDVNSPLKSSVSLNITTSGPRISPKKPYMVSEAVLDCVLSNKIKGKEVSRRSYKEKIFYKALEELGIPKEDTRDGLFIKEFTREEEIMYCNLILDGLVALNGSERGKLESWLRDHAWNTSIEDKYKFLKTGLYTYILTQRNEFIFKCQRDLLNECIEYYGEDCVVGITTDSVFVVEEVDDCKFPISYFVIFAGEDDIITTDDRNTLEGYTGEVFSLDYIERNEGMYVGCPIELYTDNKGSKGLFVDFEQTSYYMRGDISWFSYETDATIDFNSSIYVKGVFKEGSYEDEIFRAFGNSENGVSVGIVSSRKTKKEEDLFEKAKEKVYNLIVADGKLKSRRDGLLALQNGMYGLAEGILLKEFNATQICELKKAFDKGISFEAVWKVANPVFSGKVMRDLIREVC